MGCPELGRLTGCGYADLMQAKGTALECCDGSKCCIPAASTRRKAGMGTIPFWDTWLLTTHMVTSSELKSLANKYSRSHISDECGGKIPNMLLFLAQVVWRFGRSYYFLFSSGNWHLWGVWTKLLSPRKLGCRSRSSSEDK